MAHFTVVIDTELPAEEAWRRVLDLRAHSAIIPLTRVVGDAMAAGELTAGSRFTARTGLGPIGFDDRMVVDEITAPSDATGTAGLARIRKEGRAIRGVIEFRAIPSRGGGSRVEWDQEIRVRGVPRAADPVTARVGSAAYGTVLHRLLAHEAT